MPVIYELIPGADMYTFYDIWLYAAKGSLLLIMLVAAFIQLHWSKKAEEARKTECVPIWENERSP